MPDKVPIDKPGWVPGLEDRCEASCELVFLDDQMVLGVVFKEVEVPESLHKYADSPPHRDHYCRQFFVRNLDLDANAPRIFLAATTSKSRQVRRAVAVDALPAS